MRCVLVLCVALVAACGEQPADHHVDALAADPMRLKALRAQCAADRQATGEDACRAAAEAFRRRFFSGEAGPDEYQTLADLPSIPPSFDEPADGVAPAPPTEPEGTP
ncbi:TPA: EexN family lipoprotein [Pseudomonas aeruginosa]|uniref:EexN family lipoprotein n=1 Tax=Pseudomonas aeruginosa TaxID=287 RepID=UPI000F8172B9|nr:EexN family lipoprotein [Pseudomonas aeruginosa]EKB4878934.1 EexN family lipoprotein [Pseudomonas aeruginosa]EKB9381935.1 EexN family lipoprotein [Pseudomonas aeruginosa]EKE7664835.1 EexN family lipoprotein [Pseudomonas aeruginosa]ELR9522999.1 EexN family lipoprotein [Pseudomonas aeruginosa]MBV5930188.1 EexN family lipoprotein [Pseudomonas aeruginosa]